MEITIIRADETHARFCAESRYEVFRFDKDYTSVKEEFIDITTRYFMDHRSDDKQITLVALDGDKPLGCGTLLIQERLPHIEHYQNLRGYIVNVFVMPTYRGKGLAKIIMAALHDEARNRNVIMIDLHAAEKAIPLYRSLGYIHNEYTMEYDVAAQNDPDSSV